MRGLTGVLILVAGLVTACQADPKKPGYEFLPDMARSVPYDSFAPNPVTSDGKTLQAPPAGTIPLEFTPYHYEKTPEEAERAGRELVNPVPRTEEFLARGKRVYETFCSVCHGPEGKGDGPVIPKFPNPPSFEADYFKNYPEGKLYHVITKGSVIMPSYATQISPEDRWRLVHYVRTLMQSDSERASAGTDSLRPAERSER